MMGMVDAQKNDEENSESLPHPLLLHCLSSHEHKLKKKKLNNSKST